MTEEEIDIEGAKWTARHNPELEVIEICQYDEPIAITQDPRFAMMVVDMLTHQDHIMAIIPQGSDEHGHPVCVFDGCNNPMMEGNMHSMCIDHHQEWSKTWTDLYREPEKDGEEE
jgi:hypothetical protein